MASLNRSLCMRMGNAVLFKATAQLKSAIAVFPYTISEMSAKCSYAVRLHQIPGM